MIKGKKKVVLLICGLLLIAFVVVQVISNQIVNKANSISINSVDLTEIKNGDYTGEYSVSPVYVKVKVVVQNHQIKDIDILKHSNGFGSSAENIVDDIISNQSLDVDAVSGATVSSKCILKAIENAVEKGK